MPLELERKPVKLDRIEFAAVNREMIVDAEIDELAKTMDGASGLINAVTLVPHATKKDWYLCVAGERRIRAARKLKWKEIDAVIRHDKLDDAAIKEIRLVENLTRVDLTVWDEAAQLADLKSANPELRLEDIAAQIGRGEDWIACRLAIDKLIPELRDLVEKQDWPVSLMPLLARVTQAAQSDLLALIRQYQKQGYGEWNDYDDDTDKRRACAPTYRTLKKLIERSQRFLSGAPWKLDDAEIDKPAGACSACPKRSSAEPLLFVDPKGKPEKGDRCLDAACWDRKMTTFVKLGVEKLAAGGDKPLIVRQDYNELPKETLKAIGVTETDRLHQFNEVKKGTAGARPAIVVDGENAGKTVYLKSWQSESNGRAKKEIDQTTGKPKPPSKGVRLTALRQKRQCRAVELWSESMEKIAPKFDGVLDVLIVAMGTSRRSNYRDSYGYNPWGEHAKMLKAPATDFAKRAWAQLRPVLQERLKRLGPIDKLAAPLWQEAVKQSKAVGEQKLLVECWKKACEEIKLPKVLERDGVKDVVAVPK